ncbi:MAG: DMT family transporter [Lachnospiraceae bacterium]|jgi:drug/metabolite transporter (DMT)-like permease|nr:DMT family transporter [Lachnospiraceae bacterium]MCI1327706.1 DMT family transporter [Lachnospiraceae bacterium]
MKKERFWTATPVIFLMTLICCFLWGSAFPCVKIGYRLFRIASGDSAGQLLFAGVRFTLAGLLVLLFGSLQKRRVLLPDGKSTGAILILALFQTIGQYFFFYIGMAHTSGVKSSIIEASSTFLAILIAALVFRYEKLTARKIIGCLIGFAGVLLILIPGSAIDFSMHWNGEGFILLSALMYSFSSSFIKRFSKREDPLVLSGCQFVIGGLVLAASGAALGGRLSGFTPASSLLLLYMALISAVAYSLWSILLKYNPVSRIAVFGFMNPVLGVILSALLLNEKNQAFSLYGLLSLVLVSAGIITVNRSAGNR